MYIYIYCGYVVRVGWLPAPKNSCMLRPLDTPIGGLRAAFKSAHFAARLGGVFAIALCICLVLDLIMDAVSGFQISSQDKQLHTCS